MPDSFLHLTLEDGDHLLQQDGVSRIRLETYVREWFVWPAIINVDRGNPNWSAGSIFTLDGTGPDVSLTGVQESDWLTTLNSSATWSGLDLIHERGFDRIELEVWAKADNVSGTPKLKKAALVIAGVVDSNEQDLDYTLTEEFDKYHYVATDVWHPGLTFQEVQTATFGAALYTDEETASEVTEFTVDHARLSLVYTYAPVELSGSINAVSTVSADLVVGEDLGTVNIDGVCTVSGGLDLQPEFEGQIDASSDVQGTIFVYEELTGTVAAIAVVTLAGMEVTTDFIGTINGVSSVSTTGVTFFADLTGEINATTTVTVGDLLVIHDMLGTVLVNSIVVADIDLLVPLSGSITAISELIVELGGLYSDVQLEGAVEGSTVVTVGDLFRDPGLTGSLNPSAGVTGVLSPILAVEGAVAANTDVTLADLDAQTGLSTSVVATSSVAATTFNAGSGLSGIVSPVSTISAHLGGDRAMQGSVVALSVVGSELDNGLIPGGQVITSTQVNGALDRGPGLVAGGIDGVTVVDAALSLDMLIDGVTSAVSTIAADHLDGQPPLVSNSDGSSSVSGAMSMDRWLFGGVRSRSSISAVELKGVDRLTVEVGSRTTVSGDLTTLYTSGPFHVVYETYPRNWLVQGERLTFKSGRIRYPHLHGTNQASLVKYGKSRLMFVQGMDNAQQNA